MTKAAQLELHNAVVAEDITAAEAAIDAGAEVNAINISNDETLLTMAARLGKEKIGLWLLEKGADPTITTPRRREPLGYACKHSATLSHALLDHGARVDARDDTKVNVPLQNAIRSGFYDVADRLIEMGANINAMDFARVTPAVTAALWGSRAIFDRVCEAKPNLQLMDHMGVTELQKPFALNYKELTDERRCNAALALISAGADIHAKARQDTHFIVKMQCRNLLPLIEKIIAAPQADEAALQEASKQTLFSASESLLDNPQAWRNFDYLCEQMSQKGEELTRADLTDKQAPDGNNYLEYGIRCIGFNAWQKQMQDTEFAIHPSDLLNEDGKASTIMHNILTQNDGDSLFSYSFWEGASQEELKAVSRAVPENKRDKLPLVGLAMALRQNEVGRGQGR